MVPGVAADDDGGAGQARSVSTRATAQLVRTTVSTFIPPGPSRIGPRNPAVPKVSGASSVMTQIVPQRIQSTSASANLRRTGATSINRSNSRRDRLSRIVASSHASRSARSSASSVVPAGVGSINCRRRSAGSGRRATRPAGGQFVDAVGQRLHAHVHACGQFDRGDHSGAADLAEYLHLRERQPVVRPVPAHLAGQGHHGLAQFGGRLVIRSLPSYTLVLVSKRSRLLSRLKQGHTCHYVGAD